LREHLGLKTEGPRIGITGRPVPTRQLHRNSTPLVESMTLKQVTGGERKEKRRRGPVQRLEDLDGGVIPQLARGEEEKVKGGLKKDPLIDVRSVMRLGARTQGFGACLAVRVDDGKRRV